MTTQLVLITLSAIVALTIAGLWTLRPRPYAAAHAQPAPLEDMFAYTMHDDPC